MPTDLGFYVRATTSWYRMAMQIGMGFGKFLARVLFQELGVSVPSSVFHVLFITRSLHAYMTSLVIPRGEAAHALGNERPVLCTTGFLSLANAALGSASVGLG